MQNFFLLKMQNISPHTQRGTDILFSCKALITECHIITWIDSNTRKQHMIHSMCRESSLQDARQEDHTRRQDMAELYTQRN